MAEVARINSVLQNNRTNLVLQMDRRLQLADDVPLPVLQGVGPMFNFHLCVNQSHHPYGGGVPPTTILNHHTEFPANLACQSLNRLFSTELLFIIPIHLLIDANNRVFDYLIASLTDPRAAVIHIKADLTVVFDQVQRPPPVHPLLAARPARISARVLKERYGFSASETAEGADDNLGDCAVCLEELHVVVGNSSSSRKVLKMPCSHMFHCRCIWKWLKTSDSCPLCRAVIS